MKLIKTFAAALSVAAIALGALLLPQSASATIRTCTAYSPPPGFPNPGYPVSTGNLYFCFPSTTIFTEQQLQLLAKNTVVGALSNWTSAVRAQLNAKHVDFYVFYNGFDAFQTLGISSPDPALKANETGRSWVLPNRTPSLPNPTTSVFLFTVDQWNALQGRTPTTGDLVQKQLSGTVVHESGHQMDRVWAQLLNYTPTATALVTGNTSTGGNNYQTAINWDGARLTAQDISDLKTKYPRLLVDPTVANPKLSFAEIFAESIANYTGGGASSTEDTFITTRFPCGYAYV